MIKVVTTQAVVYRRLNNNLEFLVVKRVPEDGGFWQAITGTIDNGEEALDTLRRELYEEAGIVSPLHVSECLEVYHWQIKDKDIVGSDQVFAVEVSLETEITIEKKEHTEFRWLSLDDAVKLLKYDGNKKSMILVAEYASKL